MANKFNPDNKNLLNPALKKFWKTKSPIKVLYGGRDSSKTYDTAGFLIYLSTVMGLKFLCVRQFQNRIAESVYTVLKSRIAEFGLSGQFNVLNNKIVNKNTGASFIFLGIQRNIEEIKGTDGVDIMWIEESENLIKEQWDVIYPTIRKEGSMIVLVFNPQLVSDFVWERFILNPIPGTLARKINYNENPFLSNTSKKRIENAYVEDKEEADHIYGGEPRMDDDEAIIKRAWLLSCVDAHIKLDLDITGGKKIGFDVADSGEDLNAYILMDGGLISDLVSWKGAEDELFESAQKVFMAASQVNAKVNYDSNGVGAGVGSNMKQMNMSGKYVEYSGFDSAASPCEPHALYRVDSAFTQQTNTDYFENRKAQAWWLLADRFKATHRAVTKGEEIDKDQIISISGDINKLERLITELSTPRKKQSGRLKNIVEKKDDLKKRGIKSPNFADALVMAAFPYDVGRTETQSFTLKGL